MTISQEKLQEMNAVVQFWKFRVDELRRHLDQVVARQAVQPQSYMLPLIEMKARELADSQRGLRKAQATRGRLLDEAGVENPMFMDNGETVSGDTEALPVPEPEPIPTRERRPNPNGLSKFPLSEIKPGVSYRPAV